MASINKYDPHFRRWVPFFDILLLLVVKFANWKLKERNGILMTGFDYFAPLILLLVPVLYVLVIVSLIYLIKALRIYIKN